MSASRRSASYASRTSSFQPQSQQALLVQQQYQPVSQSRTYTNRTFSNRYQSVSRVSNNNAAVQAESNVERAILNAQNPLPAHDGQEITLNNQRVIRLNAQEDAQHQGPIPLEQYQINEDPNPIVIRKKPADKLRYRQNVTVRYLKPPTPKPSELIIIEEAPRPQPAAPPLVVRQQTCRAVTPAPIVYREAPPPPPPPAERKVVYIKAPAQPPPQTCCPQPEPAPRPCPCQQASPPPPPPPPPAPCPCQQQQQQQVLYEQAPVQYEQAPVQYQNQQFSFQNFSYNFQQSNCSSCQQQSFY